MLQSDVKNQLAQYLTLLEGKVSLVLSAGDDKHSQEMREFVTEVASMSPQITMTEGTLPRTPSFAVNNEAGETGIIFAGIPLGHEFTSFVLALIQVSGRPPKVEDKVLAQIKSLSDSYHFETYVSLTCHNCPDVVQALNIMSVVNPNITNTMIDGTIFKDEVEGKGIMAVPTVYLNGEEFASGRMLVEDILTKLIGEEDPAELNSKEPYDMLIVGGGPAGATAAIYAARKGIRTGLVAETFGGQVLETAGIENIPGTLKIEGPQFMGQVEEQVNNYGVDVIKSHRVASLSKSDLVEVTLQNDAVLKSKSVVIATGARWRNVNVPGEQEFKNKGVAYCPHCDGPLFAGKDVAVIGGGNSGVEAAIDLANICTSVTLLEFSEKLKADQVLQDRLYSLPNVTVIPMAATKEIKGGTTVEGLDYVDRTTDEVHHLNVAGVFILIGLVPNTEWAKDTLELTPRGEIVVNERGATSVSGVFAAGDCTNSAYKQIIISMGSGATAALGAFDYLIRGDE